MYTIFNEEVISTLDENLRWAIKCCEEMNSFYQEEADGHKYIYADDHYRITQKSTRITAIHIRNDGDYWYITLKTKSFGKDMVKVCWSAYDNEGEKQYANFNVKMKDYKPNGFTCYHVIEYILSKLK